MDCLIAKKVNLFPFISNELCEPPPPNQVDLEGGCVANLFLINELIHFLCESADLYVTRKDRQHINTFQMAISIYI